MKMLRLLPLQRSIFIKFTLSFILVGLIPLSALSYLLLGAFSSQVEQYTSNNLKQMMFYMGRNTNQFFIGYNELSKLMYTNYDRYETLYASLQHEDSELTPDEAKNISDFLKTIVASDRFIQNAFFVRQSNGAIYYESKTSMLFDGEHFPPREWSDSLRAHEKELSFFPTHQEQYFFQSQRQVMTFARNLIDTSTTLSSNPKTLGTLYFDVDVSVFDDLFSDIRLGKGDVVQILGPDKSVIYSNIPNHSGSAQQPAAISDVQTGDNAFVFSQDIPDAHQLLVGHFSKQELLESVLKIRQYLAIVVVACVVSLIVISLVFSRRFSLPIRGIIQVMTKVESGNLEISVPVRSEDELGQLAHGFNRMTTRLSRFINEAYVAEIKRKQAELNALKGQIRPHYLYNTLEVVRMSAVANDDMPVADMIHSLSNQLKYVLDYGEDFVSIREELHHIEDYFYLIRIRFEDKFDLETVISPDVSPDWLMMKLSIQPLVENAVQHGLRQKEGRGKIRVSIEKEEGETITVTVVDDGIGMPEDKLGEIVSSLDGQSNDETQRHVGLKNVQDRLQALFGPSFGLRLNSRLHIGTSVQFNLPVIKGGAHHVESFPGR